MTEKEKLVHVDKFNATNVALETIKQFGDTFDALVDTILLLWEQQDKNKLLQNEIKNLKAELCFKDSLIK